MKINKNTTAVLSIIALVFLAVLLNNPTSDNPSASEAIAVEKEPTLEERCSWIAVKEWLNQYPSGMASYDKYTITDSHYDENAGVLAVQGNLSYKINGQDMQAPYSKVCIIKDY